MQNNDFDCSQVFSHESLSHGCKTEKRKLEVVKQQILFHNNSSSRTTISDHEFVNLCKKSFMTCSNLVKTG